MKVIEKKLDITLPDTGIGMVIMQPFVELSNNEPYRWQNGKKEKQIERIIRTLEIAKQADHGCEKTHFTVFPEYAIPGLEGVTKIQEILKSSSWKCGTIVVGGVDGLTKDDYSILCTENTTQVHEVNKVDNLQTEPWFNCCITWAKEANGQLKRWVQPKMIPATQEKLCSANRMFEGRAVYVFRPKISIQGSELSFRFLSFICKDWIGNIGSSNVVDAVLSQIESKRDNSTDRLDIYLCFILERNPEPDNSLFLQKTIQYLNEERWITVRRSDGAVLFVNNAGKNSPGYCKDFGKSGFVFHPNCSFVSHKKCCPPTYSLKAREGLATCQEARFRESGACIISFKFRPPIPAIVRRTPATSMIPMNPAIVHPIDVSIEGVEGDPRTSGTEIPAAVKWVNDCLDTIDFVLKEKDSHPIRNEIENSHDTVCKEIRRESNKFQSNEFLCRYITIASCKIKEHEDKWIEDKGIKTGEEKIHNVDNWDENEEQSLETVVYSLSIMKACKSLKLEIKTLSAHATLKIQDKVVINVIVVCGESHEKCFEYAQQYLRSEQQCGIVVTRDTHNTLWNEKFGSCLKIKDEDVTEKGPRITDWESRYNHCGYQNLISGCFNSKDLTELNNKVREVIGV